MSKRDFTGNAVCACVCVFVLVCASRVNDQPVVFDGALKAYRGSEELKQKWAEVAVPVGVDTLGVVRLQANAFDYPAVEELLAKTRGKQRTWMPEPCPQAPSGIVSRQSSSGGEDPTTPIDTVPAASVAPPTPRRTMPMAPYIAVAAVAGAIAWVLARRK